MYPVEHNKSLLKNPNNLYYYSLSVSVLEMFCAMKLSHLQCVVFACVVTITAHTLDCLKLI